MRSSSAAASRVKQTNADVYKRQPLVPMPCTPSGQEHEQMSADLTHQEANGMPLRQSAVFGGGFGHQSPDLSHRASQNRRKAPIGTRANKVFLPKPPPKTALCPPRDVKRSSGAEKHSPEDVKTLTRIRNVDRAPQDVGLTPKTSATPTWYTVQSRIARPRASRFFDRSLPRERHQAGMP